MQRSTHTGTPLYVAPEAIIAPDTIDGGTDMYALGAVCYWLLTGTHVFTRTSMVEVCGSPARLASISLRRRRSGLGSSRRSDCYGLSSGGGSGAGLAGTLRPFPQARIELISRQLSIGLGARRRSQRPPERKSLAGMRMAARRTQLERQDAMAGSSAETQRRIRL